MLGEPWPFPGRPPKHDLSTAVMTVPLRAALYLRVSTARHGEHDVSIPDERKQGEAYCAARGYQLVETYVEPGASATNDRRPEVQRMIEAELRLKRLYDAIEAGVADLDVSGTQGPHRRPQGDSGSGPCRCPAGAGSSPTLMLPFAIFRILGRFGW